LSERLGHEIAMQTGISLDWLLRGDAKDPPQSQWNATYKVEEFENVQAELARPHSEPFDIDFNFEFYLECMGRLGSSLVASVEADKYRIFQYKLRQILDEIEAKFGTSPTLNENLRTNIVMAASEAV